MARIGRNLYKRKDGRWEGRYIKSHNEAGKPIYGSVYAKSYREAREKLNQAKAAEANVNIKEPKEATITAKTDTFQDVAQKWWESIQPRIKESTSVKYFNLLESYIKPVLGEIPINSITTDCIETYCTNLLNKGGANQKGLSPKTVMCVLSVIRTVLDYANQNGVTSFCDTNGIKVRQKNQEMQVFSQIEQDKLCRYICSNPTPTNLGILICLLTGLRIGEVCALRWEDISLTEQTIYVHQTMQRIQDIASAKKKTKVIVTTPKSDCSIRTIPIPDDLAKIIQVQGALDGGYFLTGSNDKFLEPRTMENRFKRLLDAVGIEPKNFHCLRHTFATRCVELGFDVKTLSVILGHASVNITMNRYVHPSMNMKKENMQRVSIPYLVK